MVGWWVILSPQTPEERDTDPDRKQKVLAPWETGVQGLRWLQEMVAKGKVQEHSLKGGYPNRYTANAENLLPLFAEGPPLSPGIDVDAWDESSERPVLVRGNQNWNVTLHQDRMDACLPNQQLTVEVWDQS